MLVHNVLQNNVCHALSTEQCLPILYISRTLQNTKNNKYIVSLPRTRTEYARKGFFYMGAKTLDELPLTVRMSDNVFASREIINNICTRFYHVNDIKLLLRASIVMYLCFLVKDLSFYRTNIDNTDVYNVFN